MLSVAMCTFNGERFVDEQLASIAAQDRLPDELVVVDDGSADGTVRALHRFAASAPFAVHVHVNPARLGYARNFEKAIRLAAGDVIALADQDDVWVPGKLGALAAALDAAPSATVAFSDARVVGPALEPTGMNLWQTVGLTPEACGRMRSGGAFDLLLRRTLVTGATMAFRATLRPLVLPVAGPDHDAWIALLASAVSDLAPVEEPLVLYRQHGANQIGATEPGVLRRVARSRRQGREGLEGRLARHRAAAVRLEQAGADAGRVARLRASVRHLEARVRLPAPRLARVGPIVSEVLAGGYASHSDGCLSALRDFIV